MAEGQSGSGVQLPDGENVFAKNKFRRCEMIKMRIVSLAVFAVCIMSFAAPAFATSTRDKGMGLYENPWMMDGLQSYIYDNPSYMDRYKNMAFFERIGVVSGQSMGGIFYSPQSGMTIGVHFGSPLDSTVWNSTDKEGLFNKDTYAAKAKNRPVFTGPPANTYTGYYQAQMLSDTPPSGRYIDISDPDGNAVSTSTESYRKSMDQRNISVMFSYNTAVWSAGAIFGYSTSWVDKKNSFDSIGGREEYIFRNSEYDIVIGGVYVISRKMDVDASLKGNFYVMGNTYDATTPTMNTEMVYRTKGAMDVGGSARLNMEITAQQKIHVRVAYTYMDRSTYGRFGYLDDNPIDGNFTLAKDTFTRSGQLVNLGVSDEFKFSKDLTAFIGMNIAYKTFSNDYSGENHDPSASDNDKYTCKFMSIQVPIIAGLETKMTENWTVRFAIASLISQPIQQSGSNITDSVTGTPKTSPSSRNENSGAQTTLNVGLSYRLGNFSFDWLGNIDLFVIGPYLVSGKAWKNDDNTAMSMAFAATYHFDAVPNADAPKADSGK
jgi:hypothetical protein